MTILSISYFPSRNVTEILYLIHKQHALARFPFYVPPIEDAATEVILSARGAK